LELSFSEYSGKGFPAHAKDLSDNYLSLAFSDLTTYADKVRKLVSRVKKLARQKVSMVIGTGIKFDGNSYITEKQFESQYRRKRK
jgi:hypothetical protein